MKKLLLLTALILAGYSYSQSKITLTLEGLSDEISSSMQPGELILNSQAIDSK